MIPSTFCIKLHNKLVKHNFILEIGEVSAIDFPERALPTLNDNAANENGDEFTTLENDLRWVVQISEGRIGEPHCGNG